MTIADPASPTARARSFRRRWFADLIPSRATTRLTNVTDLPPHLLNDIGLNEGHVDMMQRQRR